jgi:hypothetical protein
MRERPVDQCVRVLGDARHEVALSLHVVQRLHVPVLRVLRLRTLDLLLEGFYVRLLVRCERRVDARGDLRRAFVLPLLGLLRYMYVYMDVYM